MAGGMEFERQASNRYHLGRVSTGQIAVTTRSSPIRNIRASSCRCAGAARTPKNWSASFVRLQVRVIIVCKFLDTDEETVRCSFAGSNQFVDLPLVFFM